jgi:hypothetical protein
VDISKKGKGKGKEHCEVGEGDDTVTMEDTSDEEDGETLQERFQLRSRPTSPLSKIHRLAWRLVSLRLHGGHAMWRANESPRS